MWPKLHYTFRIISYRILPSTLRVKVSLVETIQYKGSNYNKAKGEKKCLSGFIFPSAPGTL